jgi:hypothetical protein
MQTINWTAGSGQKISFEISAGFELDAQGRRKTSGRKEVIVSVTVDGAVQFGGYLKRMNHPVVKGCFGQIGLIAENYDRVEAAITAAEAEIEAHNATCDAHESTLTQIDIDSERFANQMAFGE